ncbi:MAG: Response regulator receiver protein [Candidatus Gallionella acididurans]|uniref:Response regulator receiver protein n=1 Tax=Candidatus Gallionella acididurans TaxID=1796491 RepID=A0A139BRB5_9PROT|nr:MAG: Response regulator receiver protein [Candidatus Gallionella acididurans]
MKGNTMSTSTESPTMPEVDDELSNLSHMEKNALPIRAGRPTLLVVDDEPSNLTLLDRILGRDYIIQKAGNGSEAIELAFANPPDLILVDVMMPIMDGFEACRRIRENASTMHVPVIFITGKNEIKDEELGFAVGASDFIHKPISAPIVVARVRSQLKIKFMQDYLRGELARLQDNAGNKSTAKNLLQQLITILLTF